MIPSKSAQQAKTYFREEFSREGYYSEEQELTGLWGGKGAKLLGLAGPVQGPAFERLCDNLHPDTGNQLTPRIKHNRRVGYDINLHVPKPVTLLQQWGDERILPVVLKAARQTLADIEREMATRVRGGGRDEDRMTGNMVWAEFVHFTARPVDGIPDPHLHVHFFAFNTTFDPVEKRWKAAQFGDIKRDARYYQAMYMSRLATELRELGYGIELSPNSNSFEITGIPRELHEKFSRRSKQVKAIAKELGIDTHAGKEGLAAQTREKKLKGVPLNELKPKWWERLTPEEKRALDTVKNGLTPRPINDTPEIDPNQRAVDLAIKHIFERVSVTTERDLIAQALEWGYGTATVEGVKQVVKDKGLIRVERKGKTLVTTWEVRAEEGRIIDRCKQGKWKHAAINPAWRIQDMELNLGQKGAVFHAARSRDFIVMITGRAGVGKSRLMKELRDMFEGGGKKTLVLTPLAITAHDTMLKDGFADAQTVAKLLENENYHRAAHGAVWMIDEAGLLSNRTMDRLTHLAERLEARLVLIGDSKQHHAVERGQAFELLEKFGEIEVVTVDEIQRQKGDYKRAVEQSVSRDFAGAFKTLEQMRAFREMPLPQMKWALATDYLKMAKKGYSTLIVAPTHAECENITHAIRAKMKERGEMTDGRKWSILKNVSWTEAERSDPRRYQCGQVVKISKSFAGFKTGGTMEVVAVSAHGVWVENAGQRRQLSLHHAKRFNVYERDKIEISQGDRIRITANGRDMDGHRLNNGGDYTVEKITRDGDLILDNGFRLDKNFEHLAYGYTSTSHSAQGKTVDCVLVAQSSLLSAGATDAKQFYVSISRGRKEVRIYTDDIEALRELVAREREREMAMEITNVEEREDREPDMAMEE